VIVVILTIIVATFALRVISSCSGWRPADEYRHGHGEPVAVVPPAAPRSAQKRRLVNSACW
jgi:hypothetical protein